MSGSNSAKRQGSRSPKKLWSRVKSVVLKRQGLIAITPRHMKYELIGKLFTLIQLFIRFLIRSITIGRSSSKYVGWTYTQSVVEAQYNQGVQYEVYWDRTHKGISRSPEHSLVKLGYIELSLDLDLIIYFIINISLYKTCWKHVS